MRHDYKLRILNADGEERRLHINSQTIFEDGEYAGSLVIAQDTTEQDELKQRLERDKDFIDQLIESANAMIGVVDEQGKLIVFNRRFEEVTGFSKAEALGSDPLSLYVPKESHELILRKMRDQTAILHSEVPIVSKGGDPLVITWSAARVKLPSGKDGVVFVGRDVTEQRRMQEELTQSQKLASIGELVSGVAHELNNPLTVVMGYSQMLSAEQNFSPRHAEMAQKVFDAATRSKKIVENLLAFARKRKLEKHEVNLNELMESTLALREHNFMVNNVKIIRNYDLAILATYGDGHQLQQVFLNLINNAFDAMSGSNNGGTLEVKTYRSNGRAILEIIDDGPGVPESAQEKVFDPFFTTKEVGKGTGLGMSLSYGIMREHGGRIYLDKTYRDGARFVVEIPLTETPTILSAN
jgi:two-component system NtrC family sensor kinase